MPSEATPPAPFDVADPTDADDAARLLTERYAAGADRLAWQEQGVTLSPEAAALAVLGDPSPSPDALVALVALTPRGQDVWDLYEHLAMTLARSLEQPVPWETLGRALNTSKQGAKQRFERRQRDAARLDAYRPELERPRPAAAGQRAWLDEHAVELRHVVTLLQFHRAELLAIDTHVAFAVHDLGRIHYMLGDADVLAGARRVMAAIEQAQQDRAALPSWDQVRLTERAWQVVDRLAVLVKLAP
ncbi:hypothetical protein FHR32_007225 [Streptosporangium album]|uniref:Uncharacterized protein n=1 Tax=Streptosporangium album TaxID=47479 RepID=A0A7W7WDX1_9ACTN|nr:hypothetical protein [Streptosporangium album]MBB4942825.1 hypothetical protein [Streptosporangium album]